VVWGGGDEAFCHLVWFGGGGTNPWTRGGNVKGWGVCMAFEVLRASRDTLAYTGLSSSQGAPLPHPQPHPSRPPHPPPTPPPPPTRRRPASGTANPRGGENPHVSEDGGHTLVDVRFYEGLKLFGEDAGVGWGWGFGFGLGIAWMALGLIKPKTVQNERVSPQPKYNPHRQPHPKPLSKLINPHEIKILQYARIADEISCVEGVLATGLILNRGTAAVIADESSGVMMSPLEQVQPSSAASA